MYGFSKEEALGKIPRELLKTKFPKPIEQIKEELLLTGKWEGELVHSKADGSYIFVASHWVLHRDNNGKPVAIIEVNNDITGRIAAEKALQESEQRWSTTLASIGDAVIATDVSGKVMFMNSEAEELTGWALSEASQKRVKEVFNIVNGQTRLEVENPIDRVLKEGMVVGLANHTVLIRKDGSEVPIDDSGAPIKDKEGKTTGVVLVFRNITERKRQEREIENIAKFPSENPNPIFRVDGKGTILYGNQAGDSFLAVWNSKVGERAPEHISRVVADALASDKRVEVEETFGDKIFSILFAPVILEGYVNIYANEITERKKAEEALRESEQRWSTTLASIGDAVIATDVSGRVMFMNSVAEKLTGWTLSETSLKPLKEVFHIINEQTRLEVEDPVNKVLEKGVIVGLANHTVLIRKDGTEVPIDDSGAPIKDKDGKTLGIVLVFRDITKRKKLEDSLKESEERFLFALKNAPVTVGNLDRDLRFTWVYNPQAGYTLQDMIGKKFGTGMNLEDENGVIECLNEAISKGIPARRELRGRGPLGKVIFDIYFEPKRNAQNEITGVSFVALNITERKKADEALKESERKYHWLFSSMAEMYEVIELIYDKNGKAVDYFYVDVNDAFARETGKTKEELLNRRVKELFNPVEDYWIETFDKASKSDSPLEYANYTSAMGKYYEGKAWKVKDNQVASFFADVTERKKTDEALKKSEEEYSSLFANMIDGFAYCQMIYDEKGKPVDFVYLQVNDAFERITGLKRDLIIGKKVTRAIPGIKETNPELFEIYGRVALTCQKEKLEYFLKPLSLWLNVSVYCPAKGYFAAVLEDITERKQAEEALTRQAELIDLSPDAIIVLKLDGSITFWSRGAEKLCGWTKDEAIGKDIHSLLKAEFPEPLEEILSKVKLDGKWSGEIVHTCKDGNKVAVQSYWLGKFGADGKIVEILESNVDITERLRMQANLEESAVLVEEYANKMEALANQRAEQLRTAERLAAIGATAGMVGHDIRNPLQAITGDLYLAKAELVSTPESIEKKNALESLQGIEKNIDYINKIVSDLQDYTRTLRPVTRETNLQKLVDELLAKNGIPENVKVQVMVQKEAVTIMADPDILKRIFGNLVTNAVQAMPNGGKLTIQAYKEANDSIITVADTGVGIPEEAKEKLFTPLFTTKSKGQGFGLAVVKRMTEALGGTVTFESQQGKGTKFIVRLPSQSVKR